MQSTTSPLLVRELPLPVAVATVLRPLHARVETAAGAVPIGPDPKLLHELRVAVRRSRTVVKSCEETLADPVTQRLAQDLRWLAEVTTLVRDLDVAVRGVRKLRERLGDGHRERLRPFVDRIEVDRVQAYASLRRTLGAPRFEVMLRRWDDAIEHVGNLPSASLPEVGPHLDRRIRRQARKLSRHGDAITSREAPETLHDLRKRVRDLRYLVETFADLYPCGDIQTVAGTLKGIQQVLGEFYDAHLMRSLVLQSSEPFATAGAPTATLVTMGLVTAFAEEDMARARAVFPAEYRAWSRPETQRCLVTLTRAAA